MVGRPQQAKTLLAAPSSGWILPAAEAGAPAPVWARVLAMRMQPVVGRQWLSNYPDAEIVHWNNARHRDPR